MSYSDISIIESFDDGRVRDMQNISWCMGDDGFYHFRIKPCYFTDLPSKAEHYISIFYINAEGQHYGSEIKLLKYIGESHEIDIMDDKIASPTWEYKGCFLRPWTPMVSFKDEKGITHWNYLREED